MSKVLRLEAVAIAAALIVALYGWQPNIWLVVVVLIAPDLAMIGYLSGPRLGAQIYNAAHSVIGPALLAVAALYFASDLTLHIAALWALHIAIDRALGYGLKFPDAFQNTHLGRIGK